MNSGPRILFHTYNRRGLGHLMRGLNIAAGLLELNPNADIAFYTRGTPPKEFIDIDARFFVEPKEDASSWPKLVSAFGPNVIVYDTLLPQTRELDLAVSETSFVLVMRKCSAGRQAELFTCAIRDRIDRVIIPHEASDYGYPLPNELAAKTHFVGSIVRRPRESKQAALVAKYGLASRGFTLVSTPGGGGFVDEAKLFFDVVLHAQQLLETRLPGLRHIVIKGPRYPHAIDAPSGVTVVDSEPDLVHLFPLIDLVVSAGGYNTVSEIRVTRTPAAFLPSPRTHDDQRERVAKMATAGLAQVCTATSPAAMAQQIADLCMAPHELSHMRQRYAEDSVTIGNESAARLIMELASG